jgi:hypothetical protein
MIILAYASLKKLTSLPTQAAAVWALHECLVLLQGASGKYAASACIRHPFVTIVYAQMAEPNDILGIDNLIRRLPHGLRTRCSATPLRKNEHQYRLHYHHPTPENRKVAPQDQTQEHQNFQIQNPRAPPRAGVQLLNFL